MSLGWTLWVGIPWPHLPYPLHSKIVTRSCMRILICFGWGLELVAGLLTPWLCGDCNSSCEGKSSLSGLSLKNDPMPLHTQCSHFPNWLPDQDFFSCKYTFPDPPTKIPSPSCYIFPPDVLRSRGTGGSVWASQTKANGEASLPQLHPQPCCTLFQLCRPELCPTSTSTRTR